jgi:Mg/Co/Ni transporter MgtE
MAEPLRKEHLHDPVARHMRHDFVRLRIDQTVGAALEQIRLQQPEGRIVYFYGMDAEGRLAGVVPTRRLLLSPPDRPLAEIMVRNVVAIPSDATVGIGGGVAAAAWRRRR